MDRENKFNKDEQWCGEAFVLSRLINMEKMTGWAIMGTYTGGVKKLSEENYLHFLKEL